MRRLILFFVFLLMGTVLAEDVEVQVESPMNRTYDSSSDEEISYLGYVLMIGGIVVLVILFVNLCLTYKKKKKIVSRSSSQGRTSKKDVLSWFLRKEKIDPRVLSQSHYVKIEDTVDEQEILQRKNDELMSLKEDILHEYPKVLDEDVKRVLQITDDLLGEIPEDKVDTFVHSPDFEVYKKVMKKVHEPLHENKEGLEKIQKVLELFEKGVVDGDEARRLLGLPVRH